MKVLVLGARGMLGHVVCRALGGRHDVFGTSRHDLAVDSPLAAFLSPDRWIPRVEATDVDSVAGALDEVEPDVVVNCIGIIKQVEAASDPIASIAVNALFPHRLAALCAQSNTRMVHFSTDCVFSGRKGKYVETDSPDPVDLYGRSKLLGETEGDQVLTLRTSVVGREIQGYASLFEWTLANRGGSVLGFDRAVYSGLTTMALAEIIERLLVGHPELNGIWHVASQPITKYDLLSRLNDRLGLGMEIERDVSFVCDRSLDGSAFSAATGIVVPSWDDMLTRFVEDQSNYAHLEGESR